MIIINYVINSFPWSPFPFSPFPLLLSPPLSFFSLLFLSFLSFLSLPFLSLPSPSLPFFRWIEKFPDQIFTGSYRIIILFPGGVKQGYSRVYVCVYVVRNNILERTFVCLTGQNFGEKNSQIYRKVRRGKT